MTLIMSIKANIIRVGKLTIAYADYSNYAKIWIEDLLQGEPEKYVSKVLRQLWALRKPWWEIKRLRDRLFWNLISGGATGLFMNLSEKHFIVCAIKMLWAI